MLVKTFLLSARQSRCILYSLRGSASSASFQWQNFTPAGLVDKAPSQFQPFLKLIRMDKPTGTFLLFWPASWGIALATPMSHLPDIRTVAIFATGSFLMRGAACIINDLWDRRYDAQVERTRLRPLASGQLQTGQAMALLSVLLGASFGCLVQLNMLTIIIGISSIIPTIAYPLAKRYTYWPQVALGATINYGAIMGFTAVSNELSLNAVLPLYFSAICWTMIYDTIYAHQDKEDDSKIGVKSTALKFQENTKPWLTGFATGMISNMALAGVAMNQSWPFYLTLAAASCHFGWQIKTLDIKNRENCWKKFNSNQWIGGMILIGILSGTLLK